MDLYGNSDVYRRVLRLARLAKREKVVFRALLAHYAGERAEIY